MFRLPLVRFLTIIVAGFCFFQCTFHSDEKFFNDLPLPNPAAVGVILSTVNLSEYEPGETVDIFGTTSFSVLTNGQHGDIESLDVFLADEEISIFSSVNTNIHSDGGHFMLPLNLLTEGTFPLRVEFMMRTASGSLADQLATERFKVIQQWNIRVDLSPPAQPIASIATEDGFLTLRWSPYSKTNFQSYRITRRWGTGTQTSTFNITDSLTTHWKDESYVGGYSTPVRYTVSVVSETGIATSHTMDQYNPSNERYSFNPMDSIVTVRWTPTPFYGPFLDYRFSAGLSAGSERISITNITDSIFTHKLKTVRFGGVSKVAFEIRSQLPEIITGGPVGQCELGTALPVSVIVPISFNAFLQSYVTVDPNNKLLELNDDFESVRDLATLSASGVTMPYPGNYVYYAKNRTASSYNLTRLNLADNSVLALNGTYDPNLYLYSGASNGLVCFDYTRIPVPSNNIPALFVARVTDPESVGDVYYESSGTVNVSASISDDGRFIWANGRRVFKISDGSSTLIGTVPGTMTFHGFRKDYCDQMIFQEANRIYIYDANTLMLIRSIEVPSSGSSLYYVGSYDVQTKTVLCSTSFPTTNLHLINLDTGERKTIAASRDMNTSDVYLVNGRLIYGGKYIKVL